MHRSSSKTVALATWVALWTTPASADCLAYQWDVGALQALYASAPVSIGAANDAAAAPKISLDKLYELNLLEQSKVTFAMAPGKASQGVGVYGGTVAFTVPRSAAYLVGLDQGIWIDVVANGKLTPTKDFHGQRDCDGPHKIVEFALTEGTRYLLQFSAGTRPAVRVTVSLSHPKS